MNGLFDLHTHTILSDGEMLPIEVIRRMAVTLDTTVAITDHVDTSNTETVQETLALVRESAGCLEAFLCGVEITHVPPSQIASLARKAKAAGADIVVVQGRQPSNQLHPYQSCGLQLPGCQCARPSRPDNGGRGTGCRSEWYRT